MGLQGRCWQGLGSQLQVQLKKDLLPDSLVQLPVSWNFSFECHMVLNWLSPEQVIYMREVMVLGDQRQGEGEMDKKREGKNLNPFPNLTFSSGTSSVPLL